MNVIAAYCIFYSALKFFRFCKAPKAMDISVVFPAVLVIQGC